MGSYPRRSSFAIWRDKLRQRLAQRANFVIRRNELRQRSTQGLGPHHQSCVGPHHQGDDENRSFAMLRDKLQQRSTQRPDFFSTGNSGDVIDGSTEQGCPTKPKSESEIDILVSSIHSTIGCLFKMPIRQPARYHKLAKISTIDVSHYKVYDMRYPMDKFPDTARRNPELIERFTASIQRRRQLLEYRQSHRMRLDPHISTMGNFCRKRLANISQ